MSFDPQTLVTAGTSLAAIVSAYGWARTRFMLKDSEALVLAQLALIRSMSGRLHEFELKEARRIEKCREAAAKGKATQLARASEARAQRTREANERTAKTLDEFSRTALRTRAQVVAPVKAKRTRAKKSAEGVASKTAG